VPGKPFRPTLVKDDSLADFKTLQGMWQECPPPAEDAAMTARYAAIGLAAGVQGFDGLSPAVLKGLLRAEQDGRQQVVAASRSLGGTHTANGWTLPRPRLGYYDDGDYLYRAWPAPSPYRSRKTPITCCRRTPPARR
jgi:hypothetical protein